MAARPGTPRSDLDRLPQFKPDRTYGPVFPFPETRAREIRDVLTSAMKDHVRQARFLGEPTSLKRCNAMLAIARYESRWLLRRPDPHDDRDLYDRKRASGLVKKARDAVRALQQVQQTLEPVVEWKQLNQYLEALFVANQRQREEWRRDERKGGRPIAKLSVRAVLQRRKQADRYRAQFRVISPRRILNQLRHLELLLILAWEKLKFRPGDFERDEIAREFADAMVFAWMSATGLFPPISKSKPLAFQQLLAAINLNILKPEIRSETDFRHHAVLAVNRARKTRWGRIALPREGT